MGDKVEEIEKIYITAHAGAMVTKANSIESIKVIKEYPIYAIEVDVNLDFNGDVILSHDKSNDGVFFKDFLEEVKDLSFKVNLDIKDSSSLVLVTNILKGLEKDQRNRFFFTGVDFKTVEDNKNVLNGFSYYINAQANEINLEKINDADYLIEVGNRIKDSGAIGVNMYYKYYFKELKDILDTLNLKVSMWTVDDEKDIEEVISKGANYITTNNLKYFFEST